MELFSLHLAILHVHHLHFESSNSGRVDLGVYYCWGGAVKTISRRNLKLPDFLVQLGADWLEKDLNSVKLLFDRVPETFGKTVVLLSDMLGNILVHLAVSALVSGRLTNAQSIPLSNRL